MFAFLKLCFKNTQKMKTIYKFLHMSQIYDGLNKACQFRPIWSKYEVMGLKLLVFNIKTMFIYGRVMNPPKESWTNVNI